MLLIAVPIEKVQEIWPTKMDCGWPNAEIGQKMANGRLLFLALHYYTINVNSIVTYCIFLTTKLFTNKTP